MPPSFSGSALAYAHSSRMIWFRNCRLLVTTVIGGRRRISVHAASPPWKVALLSFPRPTAWRLTDGDMATGICNDVLGSAVGRRKTARRVWSGRISSVPTSSKFRRRFRESCQRQPFSAVAHYMSRRPQWKQTGLLSAVLHTSVFLGSGEFLNRSSVFLVTAAYVGRGLVSVGFVDTGAKPFQLRLERSLLRIGDRSPKILASG
ncbi:hypothetical protein TNCV_1835961 [Trichonephila clavipes]|nr:hypothetical protein TNCV_1835961 [Trichonephila clavipes]